MVTMLYLAHKLKNPFKRPTSLVPHGVPVFVAPIIWIIEFIGLFTRAFSLAIRLFANMKHDDSYIYRLPHKLATKQMVSQGYNGQFSPFIACSISFRVVLKVKRAKLF